MSIPGDRNFSSDFSILKTRNTMRNLELEIKIIVATKFKSSLKQKMCNLVENLKSRYITRVLRWYSGYFWEIVVRFSPEARLLWLYIATYWVTNFDNFVLRRSLDSLIPKTCWSPCIHMYSRFVVIFSPGNFSTSVRKSKYLWLQLDRQAIAHELRQGPDIVV